MEDENTFVTNLIFLDVFRRYFSPFLPSHPKRIWTRRISLACYHFHIYDLVHNFLSSDLLASAVQRTALRYRRNSINHNEFANIKSSWPWNECGVEVDMFTLVLRWGWIDRINLGRVSAWGNSGVYGWYKRVFNYHYLGWNELRLRICCDFEAKRKILKR